MQFLFILLLNICMWALFYLIISLKLEKSASHFREQKLRTEMDEIIREFNAVAERNISMLDTRIRTVKRLMERGGDIRSVNMLLDDGDEPPPVDKPSPVPEYIPPFVPVEPGQGNYPGLLHMLADFFKKGLLLSVRRLNILIYGTQRLETGMPVPESQHSPGPVAHREPVSSLGTETPPPAETIIPEIEDPVGDGGWEDLPGEKELKSLFAETDDKYALVEDLYRKGYSIETLSRYSGIPAGEVKLVLNLTRPV